MVSVSQMIEDIAEIMGERVETVTAYARALIDEGDLPKSKGRAIARVSTEDVITLIVAVALAPKIKDTSETVHRYLSMRGAGVPLDAPKRVVTTAKDYLTSLADTVFASSDDPKDIDLRKAAFDSTVTFILNWGEIEVETPFGETLHFKSAGNPKIWEAYHKRTTVLSGRVFLMLGFGKGRDYGA